MSGGWSVEDGGMGWEEVGGPACGRRSLRGLKGMNGGNRVRLRRMRMAGEGGDLPWRR